MTSSSEIIAQREFRSDTAGSIMIVLVVLLPSLFLVMSLALNSTYSTLLRAELQTAADSASLAGASAMDGTNAGWERARSFAIAALNLHGVHGSPGSDVPISANVALSASDESPSGSGIPQIVWENSGLRVSIRRGRWVRRGGAQTFESMEDADAPGGDWQAAHPGIPRNLVAGAVQVEVERSSVSVLFPTIGTPSSYEIGRAATSVSAPVRMFSIAPFALPVCALAQGGTDGSGTLVAELAPAGSLTQYGSCFGDRFFTSVSRFPSGGTETVPEFNYYPNISTPYSPAYCRWGVPQFPDLRDHFGVVGLAAGTLVTEDAIRSVISSGRGVQANVMIGDRFQVLDAGLIDNVTDDALADRILIDPPDAPTVTPDGSSISWNSTDLQAHNPLNSITWTTSSPDCQTAPVRTHGLCNSKRYTYRNRSGVCGGGFEYSCVSGNCDVDGSVWRVMIPVIADPNAAGCNLDGTTEDYEIDPAQPLEIVGFVYANIFDVDVGFDPPANPACPPSPYSPANEITRPWGFEVGGTPTRCNLVRGRVDCKMASISPPRLTTDKGAAVLIESPA